MELAEAVREVSALLREMIFLLAAQDRQKNYLLATVDRAICAPGTHPGQNSTP
jgi:hypothetical protein